MAMRMIDDRTGLEVMAQDECLRLLRGQGVGRVAVVAGGRPLIFPVNYVVDGKTIVFRTDEGAKLNGVKGGFNVAFEIDGIEPLYHTGWSVLVSGVGRHVVDATEVAALAELPLRPWAARERSPKSNFVRIRPDTITGRRIVGLDG
jgi:nitroimidazol reductase NimA-like FMN-containing flavoprotein (pyridoxamine 5'-phosphate oxidase superfamily)